MIPTRNSTKKPIYIQSFNKVLASTSQNPIKQEEEEIETSQMDKSVDGVNVRGKNFTVPGSKKFLNIQKFQPMFKPIDMMSTSSSTKKPVNIQSFNKVLPSTLQYPIKQEIEELETFQTDESVDGINVREENFAEPVLEDLQDVQPNLKRVVK